MNLERLKSMKRHDLQQEAKKYGIKANQASSVLIDLILKQQKVEIIFIRYLQPTDKETKADEDYSSECSRSNVNQSAQILDAHKEVKMYTIRDGLGQS